MKARADVSAVWTAAVFLILATLPPSGRAQPDDACIVADNGSGTVTLPPARCLYQSPSDVFMIIDGLPPGTTIELTPHYGNFYCRAPAGNGPCLVMPGGGLGGESATSDSFMAFEFNGTGELNGFHRIILVPMAEQEHFGPRNPGDPVQSFPTDFFQLQGAIFGDPDFDFLQLSGGTNFGLPSPGQTTLTRLGPPGSDFHVDSFFDIAYQIDFVGAPGGSLDGLAGSTQGTVRIEAAGERDPCIVADDGTGTAELPPSGCDELSPREALQIIDGLPPGTTIELDPRHTAFTCNPATGCGQPGGNLGGEREDFDSTLVLQLEGTGSLSDFRRTLRLPATVQTHSGPRNPNDPVQAFPTDVFQLQGAMFGDPDFDFLQITGGTNFGLPSPGRTTLEDLGDGTFQVDSFFDIAYQIDFVGAPGGALDGLSGSTAARVKVTARDGLNDSVEDDNGLGTATLPPEGAEYTSPDENFLIIDGLPPGTTIELEASHHSFFCDTTPCSQPGGGLGGGLESFQSTLDLELRGTGSLAGYQRTISLPAVVQTQSASGLPGAPVQSFETELLSLQGSLSGDPDFDQLTITAGTSNTLPSPGHATIRDQGDGTFLIDSFFDISYRIDFVGAPGGQLDGLSGSTQGTLRLTAGDRPGAPAHNITIVNDVDPDDPADFPYTGLATFSLDDDADPTLPNRRTFNNLSPGTHTVTQLTPSAWAIDSIVCVDPDGGTTVDEAAGEASIDLDLGEAITCTFTNIPANADLAVTKTDGVTSAVPGQSVVYTIVASNAGPDPDPAATLTDTFPAGLTCTYTSVAAGGATGNTATGAGDLAETLSLPADSSVTYTVTCMIASAATGLLSNTASITASISDPVMGNNDATDDDTMLDPVADLAVAKTDGRPAAAPGQTLTYTIVATNAGPSDDPDATLVDNFPADLSCSYTSAAGGGATGNTGSGSGNLSETLSLPAASSVTYTVECAIAAMANGTLFNTAVIFTSVTDPALGNNTATDETEIAQEIFDGGFESITP